MSTPTTPAVHLGDGTNNAAIKAASTAPSATDAALVVSLSPNSPGQGPATIPAATVMQNAAVASGNGTSLPVTGYGGAIINIVSSPSMSGGTTVNFEASVDDTTWVAINAQQIGGTTSIATTTTADGDFRLNVAGYKSIRARISAYSAGTVTIKGYVSVVVPAQTTANVNIIGINGVAPVTATVGAAVPAALVYEGGICKTGNPANAADGNLVGIMLDKAGRTVVTIGNTRESTLSQYTALAANTETTIVTAGAAGVFNDIDYIILSTAGSAAATLSIKDGTGGTTKLVINYPDAALAPGGVLQLNFKPPLAQASSAANWTVTNSVSTATNITVGYTKNL